MARTLGNTGPSFEILREPIEISTALPQPDPSWTYTDHAGHAHSYDANTSRYPTLVRRTTEPYWCEDCGDEHTDSWLECPLCGEKIQPGTFIDPAPRLMPGRTTYLIDGESVSPEVFHAAVAEAEARRS